MARLRSWKVSWRLLAQSFLSSRICLSIMSFIMVMVLVGIYIVLVEGEYCIECRDTKREQRQAQKVKMDVAGWKRGAPFWSLLVQCAQYEPNSLEMSS